MAYTYVLDMNKNPLMPCHNGGFIRTLLKNKKAKVVRNKPFTVQLLFEVRNKYKQDMTLGVDAGYKHIGFSVSTSKAEVFSAELEQECGMVERNKERRMYRRQRRSRLRYRKPRFNNRIASKQKGMDSSIIKKKKRYPSAFHHDVEKHHANHKNHCRDWSFRPRSNESYSRRTNS